MALFIHRYSTGNTVLYVAFARLLILFFNIDCLIILILLIKVLFGAHSYGKATL